MKMTSGTRLVDYFVVTGLDPDCGLEPDLLSGENLHSPPLDRPYKARHLAHYPANIDGNPFDKDAVCMLCHPKGLRFQTQRDEQNISFHPFLITREDGSRNYGAALTYYEEVEEPQIASAMSTLQAMHLAEVSNLQSLTLYSHLEGKLHFRSPKHGHRLDPKTIGRVFEAKTDKLAVTKCLAIISQIPLIATFEKMLRALLNVIQNNAGPDLPLESYIYNVIYEIPMPSPGRSMKLTIANQSIVCQRPGVHELPLLDFHLRLMFNLLGIDAILSVFTSMLLEHQVLLCSKDYQRMMLVAEGLNSLMFPFTWQHVYVPILPASLLHFLDAPVPFIMGLQPSVDFKTLKDEIGKAGMCFVDIDNKHVDVPEDIPIFPNRNGLRDELILHLNHQWDNLNNRDSGFRDSYIGIDSSQGSEATSTTSSTWSLAQKLDVLQSNEALRKITALAQKTGVITSLEDIGNGNNTGHASDSEHNKAIIGEDKHVQELICNNYIREIFLHYFLQMFSSYESFVILPNQSMEGWLTNRDQMQNFDKTAFLSDQPAAHLPFLSAFLETQMFATFIDNKIISQWEDTDAGLRIFEARLQLFKDRMGDEMTVNQHRHSMCKDSESIVEQRALMVDILAPLPHLLEIAIDRRHEPGIFPALEERVLNTEPASLKTKREAKWRKKERSHQHSEHLRMSSGQREKYIAEARSKGTPHTKLSDMNPAHMAQTNLKFVNTLLKECKTKTKRLLVHKMGQEAVELGHGELTVTGVEENTLIASLCDLLERIWSHGMQKKNVKSALWQHLLCYQEYEHAKDTGQPIDAKLNARAGRRRSRSSQRSTESLPRRVSTEALAQQAGQDPSVSTEGDQNGMQTWPSNRQHRRKASRGMELPVLDPYPVGVIHDMRSVQQMSDIKTEVGFARAWVRLSLEKKLLARHFKELLSNPKVLRTLYKRYAFLRCEDEREQFIYHLLSLNAVDYFCFTNTFSQTVIAYRVLIFPRIKSGGGTTSANCWLLISGQRGDTGRIPIPKHSLDITITHKNLGILTTMRIGHDNSGMSAKWMVEHILVRNQFTGHTYRFPCGRWLGKAVDDGSTERLLVAETERVYADQTDLMEKCRTPPRCRSPSMPRKNNEPKIQISDIQEMLGDAVNNLVKHYFKPEKERGSITGLLCGEYGLVYCLEHVFQCGYKSSRIFRDKLFTWDFLEKVEQYFDSVLHDDDRYQLSDDGKKILRSYCHVMSKINQASQTVGKDGRFQIFVCIGVRDHQLQRWIKVLSRTPITITMYEEKSFLRDAALLNFLVQILDSLTEFNHELEASITKGVDL